MSLYILLEQLSIRSNKDLDLENQQIPAGVDLLKEESLHIYPTTSQKLPVIRLTPAVNFPKGTYLFYLSGNTKEGKPIADTLKIDWL